MTTSLVIGLTGFSLVLSLIPVTSGIRAIATELARIARSLEAAGRRERGHL